MDNNGFDYNALRGINPKFSLSQTSDLSATKVKPKTFSMTQGRLLIQNPKMSSTHNANSFKFALFKKPEALAIPGASRRSGFSFQAQQRTQAESSSQNRLSAPLFLSDVQEVLKAPVNILQDRDIGSIATLFREYRSDDDYRAKKRRVITIAVLTIHPASRKSPPNRRSHTASHREIDFSSEYSRKNDRTASLTSIPGESSK